NQAQPLAAVIGVDVTGKRGDARVNVAFGDQQLEAFPHMVEIALCREPNPAALMGRDPEPAMRWTGRAPISISPPPCPGSSVGRATDWKAVCRWSTSAPEPTLSHRHHQFYRCC